MALQEKAARITQAAVMIKNGNRRQAYQLLRQVLQENPDDWRAWWGLVHASTDPKERYAALQKTVQFNPNHEKARQLLRQIKAKQQAPAPSPLHAPADNPFDTAAASPAEPWDNPFAEPAAAASPFVEPEPWDNPFAEPAAASPFEDPSPFDAPVAGEPAPWDAPLDSSHTGSAEPWDAPFSGSAGASRKSSGSFAGSKTSGGSSDKYINIAIAVVGVLVIIAVGVLLLSRLDLGSVTNTLMYGGAPNGFDGGDGLSTTGGGTITIDGGGVRDGVYDLLQAHNWVFQGEAGQHVRITAEAIGDTDPRIVLLDPNGNSLTSDDDSGYDYGLGMWDSYLTYTLPTNGEYTIRVDIFFEGEFMLYVNSY